MTDPPETPTRIYANKLTPIKNPSPLLADHPEFFEPIIEQAHFEAPALVVDEGADLHVRAWRFSYNARGIIEIPNHLKAAETAVIMVHPWGIDDGQGWNTPEPAGVADFCTKEKNHLAARHTRSVIRPFINSLRERVAFGDVQPARWQGPDSPQALPFVSLTSPPRPIARPVRRN